MIDVVVLTDSRYLEDSKTDLYKHNVFYEDELVVNALKNKNLNVLRLAWDDKDFHWTQTKFILFRTTWDYFERFDEFNIWLNEVSKKTKLINSEALIRWNIDKHYLLDLEKQGVRISKTQIIEKGSNITLNELHDQLNWKETVLKPCVSGAARHTYRLNSENIDDHESIFRELLNNESMMIQPFQYNIVEQGEVSMIVINGKYTHAILKKAKKGDFRVQDDFGGTIYNYTCSQEEILFAENAVKACPELPIYARVDIFTDNEGFIALAELELIEPELWFRINSKAVEILALSIKKMV